MSKTIFTPGPETTRALRDALGCYGTGVTVVTASSPDGPVAITANSFASVSLNPPMVLWCPAKTSTRYEAFMAAQHYAIHIMAEGQLATAQAFARDGADFSHADWTEDANGIPILTKSLARFDCRLVAQHDAGDHTIILGEVETVLHRQGQGLMFKRGQFGDFAPRT